GLHAPAAPVLISPRITGIDPLSLVFFSLPPAMNAIQVPSGAQNGVPTPSVPIRGTASCESRTRTYRRFPETNPIFPPSGERFRRLMFIRAGAVTTIGRFSFLCDLRSIALLFVRSIRSAWGGDVTTKRVGGIFSSRGKLTAA